MIAAADFNRDDRVDLAVSNCGGGGPSVLLNLGDARFAEPRIAPSDVDACAVGTGDFDRDGIPDLVTGSFGSGRVTVLIGHGDGSFRPTGQLRPRGLHPGRGARTRRRRGRRPGRGDLPDRRAGRTTDRRGRRAGLARCRSRTQGPASATLVVRSRGHVAEGRQGPLGPARPPDHRRPAGPSPGPGRPQRARLPRSPRRLPRPPRAAPPLPHGPGARRPAPAAVPRICATPSPRRWSPIPASAASRSGSATATCTAPCATCTTPRATTTSSSSLVPSACPRRRTPACVSRVADGPAWGEPRTASEISA